MNINILIFLFTQDNNRLILNIFCSFFCALLWGDKLQLQNVWRLWICRLGLLMRYNKECSLFHLLGIKIWHKQQPWQRCGGAEDREEERKSWLLWCFYASLLKFFCIKYGFEMNVTFFLLMNHFTCRSQFSSLFSVLMGTRRQYISDILTNFEHLLIDCNR